MEATKPKGRGAVIALLLIVMVGVIVCAALAVLTFQDSRESLRLIQENVGGSDEETKENDVRIAGQYMIRSTTHLSDAYRTGETEPLTDKERETLDMASKVVDEIIKDGMTPYEKERAVYDWMTHNLEQDEGLLTVIPRTQADCDNPYGVLKYHNAVCVGYATTFRLFMEMLEIPCHVVHNTENFHSWDLVQLDGDWYHTDIYSDSGSGTYAHFNMNDAMLSRNGQNWDTSYFPAANSLKYNLACQEAREGIDVYDLPVEVRKALDDKDLNLLSYRYGKDFTEHEAQLANSMLSQIQEMLWNTTEEYENIGVEYFFTPADGDYLLVIAFRRPSGGRDDELTEEEREKTTQAVQDAFKDVLEGGEDEAGGPAGDSAVSAKEVICG